MPCEWFEMDIDGEKAHGVICSRGGGRRKKCNCGKESTALCDFPLRNIPRARIGRRKVKPTCSEAVCAAHAHHVGPDRDLCAPHYRLIERGIPDQEQRERLLADPSDHALDVVADLLEQQGTLVPMASSYNAAARAARLATATSSPTTSPCREGDGAAAARELERQLSPKDETGSFAGVWTRSRSDCLDTDAVDLVLAPDGAFRPRDLADWKEYCAERAAIFEYLGGWPRQVAEMKARQLAGPAPRASPRHGPLFGGLR